MNKRFIGLFLLLTYSSLAAYSYKIINKTDATQEVALTPTLGATKRATISPGESKTIEYTGFSSGLCLNANSVKVNDKKITMFDGSKNDFYEESMTGSSNISADIFSLGAEAALDLCGPSTIEIRYEENELVAVVYEGIQ